jgi:hypothetical protein
MSRENVEQLRAGIERFLAGTSESAREDTLSRAAEGWDPEIELDASETPVLDISGLRKPARAGSWGRLSPVVLAGKRGLVAL